MRLRALLTVLLVAVAVPVAAADEEWVPGAVTTEPRPSVALPTLAPGQTIATLSYGYMSAGTSQQLFADLRLTSSDVSIGMSGRFSPIGLQSFQPTDLGAYYAAPRFALRASTGSWAVAFQPGTHVTLSVSSTGYAVTVAAGATEGWLLTATTEWRGGVPQLTASLVYSTSWFLAGK